MSHVTTIHTEFTDKGIVARVCQQQSLTYTEHADRVKIYSATKSGQVIQLPGWQYPVVIDNKGALTYDNSNGGWGDITHLHRFRQAYVAMAGAARLRAEGHRVVEQTLEDGTIRVLAEVDA